MSKIFDNVRPNLMMINLPITYWYLIQQTTHLAQKKTTTGRSSEKKIINRVSSWRRIYQFQLPKLPLLSSSFPFQVSPFPSFPPFLPPSSLLPPALGASTKSLAGPEIQTGLDEKKKKKGIIRPWPWRPCWGDRARCKVVFSSCSPPPPQAASAEKEDAASNVQWFHLKAVTLIPFVFKLFILRM